MIWLSDSISMGLRQDTYSVIYTTQQFATFIMNPHKKSVQTKLTRLHDPNINRDKTFANWSDLVCENRSWVIRNRSFANSRTSTDHTTLSAGERHKWTGQSTTMIQVQFLHMPENLHG
jgi:flavorubredoxin